MAIKPNNPIVDWVKEKSTSQSLSRGKDYRDAVYSLNQETQGHWTAEVEGSEMYEVEVWHLGKHNFNATCDCPYEMSGLCKHIIAVAYEIAETTDFDEDNVFIEEKTNETSAYNGFYDTFFLTSNEKIKEDFLRQLFEKDKSLCQQFLRFATNELLGDLGSVETQTTELTELIQSSNIDIRAIATEIANDMEALSLDFDDYYEEEGYGEYYDDDGTNAAEWGENQIEAELEPYQKKLTKSLKNSDLRTALDYYIAMYEANLICEEKELFAEVLGDRIAAIICEKINPNRSEIVDFIKKTILSQQDLSSVAQYLLNYWKNTEDIENNIETLQPILIALNENEKTAQESLDFIKSKKLIFSGTADLCFHLAESVKDDDFWFLVADSLVAKDFNVAKRYINRLKEEKNIKKFHDIAHIVWKNQDQKKSELATLIQNDLIFEEKKALYLDCWEYLAEKAENLNIYLSLLVYWNTSQKEKFIDAQKVRRPHFHAAILKHEGRNEMLLDFVKSQNGHYYTLLKYIGDIYPDEAFTLFKQYFLKDENGMGSSRSGYKSYCAKLEYLKNIAVTDAEKQVLVQRLRSIYPRHSAFLDELKQAAAKIGLK